MFLKKKMNRFIEDCLDIRSSIGKAYIALTVIFTFIGQMTLKIF